MAKKKASKKRAKSNVIQLTEAIAALLAGPKKAEKKKPGGAVNPRDGKVKKGKVDEPAQFEPGQAAGPKVFDAASIAEVAGLWWIEDGGDKFVVNVRPEEWSVMNENKVLMMLQDQNRFGFINPKPRGDGGLSEMQQLIWYVMTERKVHGIMAGLAGYPAGPREFPSGEKIIIRKSPRPVLPAKEPGGWWLVKAFIEGMLNLQIDVESDVNQTVYFHAWIRGVLYSLIHGKPGSWTQRMLLVLAGPTGCGKGRLQEMITWLLGGREADPKNYLTGGDAFNRNMILAEHQKMEELINVSIATPDRLNFSEGLKGMVANSSVTARLMRTDPTTINPFWAATLSCNNDPSKMLAFPPLTPDLREKVLMLLVREAPLPMPTESDEEKEAFNVALRAQLPAYVHWLLKEFVIPADLLVYASGKKVRYGVRDFQHPSLASQLYEVSPSAELMQMMDEVEFFSEIGGKTGQTGTRLYDLAAVYNRFDSAARDAARIAKNQSPLASRAWEGSMVDLENLLLGEVDGLVSSMARQAKKFFHHHRCKTELARLEADQPLRVSRHKTTRSRYWVIEAPGAGVE